MAAEVVPMIGRSTWTRTPSGWRGLVPAANGSIPVVARAPSERRRLRRLEPPQPRHRRKIVPNCWCCALAGRQFDASGTCGQRLSDLRKQSRKPCCWAARHCRPRALRGHCARERLRRGSRVPTPNRFDVRVRVVCQRKWSAASRLADAAVGLAATAAGAGRQETFADLPGRR